MQFSEIEKKLVSAYLKTSVLILMETIVNVSNNRVFLEWRKPCKISVTTRNDNLMRMFSMGEFPPIQGLVNFHSRNSRLEADCIMIVKAKHMKYSLPRSHNG